MRPTSLKPVRNSKTACFRRSFELRAPTDTNRIGTSDRGDVADTAVGSIMPGFLVLTARRFGYAIGSIQLKPPEKIMTTKSFTLNLCVALTTLLTTAIVSAEKIPAEFKTSGFALGCQAYTFNRFSVFEAIEKTAQAGGKVIEFYPGQKLSPGQPDVKWDHNASDEVIEKVKAQLARHHIKAVNYGVVGIPREEAEARKIFEFAKRLGLYGVTTESVEAIDTIEKLVKEYNICVGFHDHPKRATDPN